MKKLFLAFAFIFVFAQVGLAADGDPVLVPVDLASEVGSSVLPVENGGTEVGTLTDGGILLGSGVGAITPMAVLGDGAIVIGDGTTDPVALSAFSSSTGTLKVANGGTNSAAALGNDKVMISSGGAIIESATITTTELGLLNGIVSVTTGAADNDKFVTQGYVDDNVSSGSFGAGAAKTVAGGVITVSTSNYIIVTGEGDVADSVTEIAANAVGDIIMFKGKAGLGYNITFSDGTYLKLQADFIMNNEYDNITLMVTAIGANDTCMEVGGRCSNG
jgi:hypothetical protein